MSLNKKINLREGERIFQIARTYYLTMWWKYLLGLVFLGVVSFFMFQLFSYGYIGYAVYIVGIVLGIFLLFRTWFFLHFNYLVVTNERIIDFHRSGWFDVVMSSVGYREIQDVSIRKKGICSNMFNYGNLVIQSKSNHFVIEVPKVRNPQALQTLLQETSEQYRQDRKLLDINVIYKNFIKIIPDLTDEQLMEVKKTIEDQFEEVEEIQEEIAEEE